MEFARAGESACVAASPAVCAPPRAVAARRGRVNAVDGFFVVTTALFLFTCAFAYHDRWNTYAGPGRIAEFLLYAGVVLAGIAAAWTFLRRVPFPVWLVVLVELGVLAHFAGGVVSFGGLRLYGHELFGCRYDKYVHLAAAFIGALVVQESGRLAGLPVNRATRVLAFLALLGIGGLVELAEFAVIRTVPRHSVDGFTDTMGDLCANVVGGALYLGFGARVADRLSPRCADEAEASP